MNDYKISLELHELMEKVIRENPMEFEHLQNAEIFCLEKDKHRESNGKTIYADCTKVSDKFKAVFPCDFIITFYADGLALEPDIQYRLMYHELLHAGYNPETGICKIIPHDLEDFKAVIDKWGTDWIGGGV